MRIGKFTFCFLFVTLLASEAAASHIFVFNHPSPQAGGEFGSAIAKVDDIDGDGIPDLLVGAPKQDVAGNADQGQAYLISGATGALLRTFDTNQPEPGAKFGFSVAPGAGINQLLIGAPGQSNGICTQTDTAGCSVGKAFVFDGVTGNLLKELNNPNPDLLRRSGTFFGWSVASSRSLQASQLIVGAPGQNIGVARPGLVAVFDDSDPNPLPGPIITVTDPNGQSEPQDDGSGCCYTFGSVVVAVGDKDGDGVPDFLVGDARQDVGGNVDQGQAHIFSGQDGRLLITFDSPEPVAGVFFGAAVAWDRNQNILVGAPRKNVGSNVNQGRAYLISIVDGTVLRTLDLPAPWTSSGAGFGQAVATGDFDGDGIPDLLVGAPGASVPGPPNQANFSGNGLAHIFSGVTGSLLATLINQSSQNEAGFGSAVAFVDRNGDVRQDPVAGVPLQNVGGNTTQGQISGVISGGPNQAPIANAGFNHTADEGSTVWLDGWTGSTDPDGDRLLFSWTQTAGPAVIFDPTLPMTSFTAPQVDADTVLTFQLVVTDGLLSSLADTVNVTVINVGPDLTGTITALKRKTVKTQDTLTFTLSICNNGNRVSTGDFNVKYYVSVDPLLDGSDSLILTKTILTGTGISVGVCISDSNSVTVTGPTRGKYLIAQIDSENIIAEINEQNNLATRQIP